MLTRWLPSVPGIYVASYAGEIIRVKHQFWLGYPDAGKYEYFDVRRDIIQHIRAIRPDFVLTCDPWMPYEIHYDHIMAGKAAADAASLYGLMRLQTDPAVDAAYKPFELQDIVFYASACPNTAVDITDVWQKNVKLLSNTGCNLRGPRWKYCCTDLKYWRANRLLVLIVLTQRH